MKDTTKLKVFLADTYALIELLGGNLNYKPYLDHTLITTQFNLIELYYHFLHNYGKKTADKYLHLYSKFTIPITYSSIKDAMEFKLKHKEEKLSYVDCVGYALALELGIRFLTGDGKFKNKPNVEFVK
ncbi:PIN domain-containing protein [Candidatus Woesearchaeota archaeon]|nr:PIN domain-containing protein [Candidatus Woesearchaeota archaeon]